MKPIRFRAWHKKEKKLIPPERIISIFFIGGNGINEKLDDTPRYRFYDDHEIELNQYTGFKDKKGHEIYEEDIVAIPSSEDPETLIKGIVTWDNGLSIQKLIANDPLSHIPETDPEFLNESKLGFRWHDVEVIGNRYHPMLQ